MCKVAKQRRNNKRNFNLFEIIKSQIFNGHETKGVNPFNQFVGPLEFLRIIRKLKEIYRTPAAHQRMARAKHK